MNQAVEAPVHAGAHPGRVLVADDQRDVLEAVRLLLKSEGYHICSRNYRLSTALFQ